MKFALVIENTDYSMNPDVANKSLPTKPREILELLEWNLRNFNFQITAIKGEKNQSINTKLQEAFLNMFNIAKQAAIFKSHVFIFIYVRTQLLVSSRNNDPGEGMAEITDSKKYKFPIEKYLREFAKL